MAESFRILYCRCRHSRAVPAETADAVLQGLCASGASFEAVDDLCGLVGRSDPVVANLAETDQLRLAACHRRAAALLLARAGVEDDGRLRFADMRSDSPEQILSILLADADGAPA
jgi:hypothetical protein